MQIKYIMKYLPNNTSKYLNVNFYLSCKPDFDLYPPEKEEKGMWDKLQV